MSKTDDESDPEPAFSAREALRTRAFWCIAIAHIASAVPIVTLSIHLVPKLTDIGLSLPMAGVVVATYTIVALPVQFISGYLGDKFPKPPLIFVFLSLQAIALLVIAMTTSIVGAFLFAVLFGVAFGGRMPLLFSIRGEYFGRKSFATIMGMSQLPSNFMMIGAPLFAGYMFDTTGTYFVPFSFFAAFTFLGAFLILFAKKPKPPQPLSQPWKTELARCRCAGPAVQASPQGLQDGEDGEIAGFGVAVMGAVLQGETHDAEAAAGGRSRWTLPGESGSATTLTRVFSGPSPARLRVAPTLTLAGKSLMASRALPSKMVLASVISVDSHRLNPGAPVRPRGRLGGRQDDFLQQARG